MKILFYCSRPDNNRGSYRIWVNDLNNYFNLIGVQSNINNDMSGDYIILDKNDAKLFPSLKKKYSNKKIGIINHSANSDIKPDFIIVGSIEEKESLCQHKNVFLFPLIEKQYQNTKLKKHVKTDVLKICYHGNEQHLSRFDEGFKDAIEEFNKNVMKVEMKIITSNFPSTNHLPNVVTDFVKYDLNTIISEIQECDIGVAPNISSEKYTKIDDSIGLHDTDFCIRFKNKSNAGRSFVFHQLGLPVIADLTPSNLHILGNPNNGYIVFNKNSWLKALNELCDYNKRNEVAQAAKKEFERLYNPIEWTKQLYKNIKENV